LEEWAEIVQKITHEAKKYDCCIIASLGWCGSNLSDEAVWMAEAKAMTEAGVHALQLHTAPSPSTEPGRYMMIDPEKYLIMPIKAVKKVSNLPVFAKLPVDCCDTVSLAGIAQKAGAEGIVPATRWVSLTIDIDSESVPLWRGPGYGGPWSVPIMNGLIYRMRHHATRPIQYVFSKDTSAQFPDAVPVTVPIIPSGGVRFGADVIGYIMAGANAVEICAQILLEGVGAGKRIEEEIRRWMGQKGHKSIGEFQGIVKLLEASQVQAIPQWRPVVDENLCNACMSCIEACSNEAIRLMDGIAHVDENLCEGCRSCFYVCPTEAVSLKE
jgi:dihydroorotate dehydrogenase (fumarate)